MLRLLLVFLLWGMSSAVAQQPTPACEDRLQAAEKLILLLRDERDRAQQQMGQAWALAERLEKAQKLQSKAPEEDKTK